MTIIIVLYNSDILTKWSSFVLTNPSDEGAVVIVRLQCMHVFYSERDFSVILSILTLR